MATYQPESDEMMQQAAKRHGFACLRADDISELEARAHLMRHTTSGARLLYLQTDDANKAFSISFKTPAADNTGVFHILEHSVLCGSGKFPVKEPFVNLLKTSMQTFLNAMTFPDKTMYPVASTNEQDLLNLADVYMDAVFHPDIYRRDEIFLQEGWHREVDEGGSAVYNGVVYNEMKGALSDSDSVLYDTLSAALFPDTTYRFESGGVPGDITKLTYEDFLDAHRRHYRPDNSYIVLYGNMDVEKFLAFLDEGYLAPLSEEAFGPAVLNPLDIQPPVVNQLKSVSMVTAPENACVALGYVLGSAHERERVVAVDILLDALLGSNEAPLKRALLDANIADDVSGYVADALAQPFAVVQLKGARSGAADVLKEVVAREARRLAQGELDRELVRAALSHAEFVLRERDFGYADGVVYAMSAMSGWLYDEEDALAYLRFEDAFASLRDKIDEGYFENLLAEVFLENNHWACAEVVACEAEKTRAEDGSDGRLSPAEAENVQLQVARLRTAQEKPDSPDNVAKLPVLKRCDIGEAPAEEPWSSSERDGMLVVDHAIPTHGITYVYRYFDLNRIAFEDLPLVKILCTVLGRLPTASHSASEIDTLSQRYLGNMSFLTEVHGDVRDATNARPVFVAGASALDENVSWVARLVREVLLTTDFTDKGRIRDVLTQKRLGVEQMFATAGHSAALLRAGSYYSVAGVLREKMSGVEFYVFLKDLLDHYDERFEMLSAQLTSLAKTLFADDACTLSIAGDQAAKDLFWKSDPRLGIEPAPQKLAIPTPRNRHEAFIVPTDVSFSALGADFRTFGATYNGAWLLASRALSYDYLWNEVRVKGGAYGVGFRVSRTGDAHFYSYRDPRIDETLERFACAAEWLSSFSPTSAEMEGYVVSAAAGIDSPLKARELIRRQDGMYFSGISLADRAGTRKEVIDATVEQLRQKGSFVATAAEQQTSCVFGGRELVESSKAGFEVVDLMG